MMKEKIKSQIEIVLAEDNRSDAEMTLRALGKINLINTIIHLSDGQQVIDYMFAKGAYANRDLSHPPKVILLDLKMPKLTGLEVLEILKSKEETKKIPVVMLTSSSEEPDIEKCYRLGVNSYIVKPVGFPEFVKTVSDLGLYWTLHNQTSPF